MLLFSKQNLFHKRVAGNPLFWPNLLLFSKQITFRKLVAGNPLFWPNVLLVSKQILSHKRVAGKPLVWPNLLLVSIQSVPHTGCRQPLILAKFCLRNQCNQQILQRHNAHPLQFNLSRCSTPSVDKSLNFKKITVYLLPKC